RTCAERSTSILSMTFEWVGKMRSTPCPKLILRAVKLVWSPWLLEMTTPSNACKRSLSPSLIFTWTRTVSPGLKSGRSVRRVLASRRSIIGELFDIVLFLPCRAPRGGQKIAISNSELVTSRSSLLSLNLGQQLAILFAQVCIAQQIGTIAECLLQRATAPPLSNLVVVPVYQHLRNLHPAKLCWTRVMRVIQQSARAARRTRRLASNLFSFRHHRRGKRLLLRRRRVAKRTRKQPRRGIDDNSRTQLPATQHEIANRDLPIG